MPPHSKTKYIIVTGGVISGLGKGVVTASLGKLIQAQGYNVTIVKIDPYINIDAGTMRPTEHGEVFVTADGGETDQDIGTYERFLGKDLFRENNITTGQVYRTVIEKERNLEYGGKCVEVIPHIPQEVERRIKALAKRGLDVILVEVGGTIGDYQNVLFLEAFRSMHLRGDPILFVHVVYLPIPRTLGEMKTKPAQHSVRMLNETGIQPDFLVARSSHFIDEVRREKLSIFCNVRKEHVISNPDVKTIYEIPLIFEQQGLTKNILTSFGLEYKPGKLKEWKTFVENIKNATKEVKIGIVGKYFDIGDFTLEDSYISVIEAVKHASWAHHATPSIQWIDSKDFEKDGENIKTLASFDGIIVPGGFGSSGVEGKIAAIRYCRENNIPFLGLCYGMQLAVVEFARDMCKLNMAHSSEIAKTNHPVVCLLPEQIEKMKKSQYGATMRLGGQDIKIIKNSIAEKLYGKNVITERFRHRYEINPEYVEKLKNHGLVFSGMTPDEKIMQIIELPDHTFFMGSQFHPEFTSRPMKPNPLYLGFIQACLMKG